MCSPSAVQIGAATSVTATAAVSTPAHAPGIAAEIVAIPTMTRVNSDPCDRRKPSCVAPGTAQPLRRAAVNTTTVLTMTMTSAVARTAGQMKAMAGRFTLMPTLMKNRPSRRPEKGFTSACTVLRYGVSDSAMPARKAPSVSERSARAVAALAASTMNSATTVKVSRLPVAASDSKSGRTTKRPARMAMARASTAFPRTITTSAPRRFGSPPSEAAKVRRKMATMSCATSTAVAERPIGQPGWLRSARRRATTAVEERASDTPTSTATGHGNPKATPIIAKARPHRMICSGARPIMSARRVRISFSEKCRPMSNRRKTTPRSARKRAVSLFWTRPKPDGPITRPATR